MALQLREAIQTHLPHPCPEAASQAQSPRGDLEVVRVASGFASNKRPSVFPEGAATWHRNHFSWAGRPLKGRSSLRL